MLQHIVPDSPLATQSTSPASSTASQYGVIYCRVSTEEQKNGFSLDTQLPPCRQLLEREGFIVPEQYIFQEIYTGTTLDRPKLRRVREILQQPDVGALAVYDPDRLTRNLGHQLLLSEEFEQASVRLLIVSHPLEHGPEGWLFFQMRGALAEYERAKILERMKRGKMGRAQKGYPEGGIVPLGYRYVKGHKEGRYEIDEGEAALVRRIFQMCLEGMPTTTIAKQLSAERVLTHHDRRYPTGSKKKLAKGIWNKGSIHRILRSKVYLGQQSYNMYQRVARKREPWEREEPRKTRAILRDPSEWLSITVPRIIDDATYDAVQNQLKRNAALGQRRRKHDYLFLASRLRCGRCGSAMSGYTTPNGHRRYRCLRRTWQITETDHPRCFGSVHAESIETYVWGKIEEVLRDPTRLSAIVMRKKADIATHKQEVARERQLLTTALARCDRDLKRWEDAYLDEILTRQEYKEKKAEVDARRESLHAEQHRLEQRIRDHQQEQIDIRAIEAFCVNAAQTLTTHDIGQKRHILELFRIIVTWIPEQPLDIQGEIPVFTETMEFSRYDPASQAGTGAPSAALGGCRQSDQHRAGGAPQLEPAHWPGREFSAGRRPGGVFPQCRGRGRVHL